MARRQGSVTRRMWTWTPRLLMMMLILWSQQGKGQGQGRCKHVLIFFEPDVSCVLFWITWTFGLIRFDLIWFWFDISPSFLLKRILMLLKLFNWARIRCELVYHIWSCCFELALLCYGRCSLYRYICVCLCNFTRIYSLKLLYF